MKSFVKIFDKFVKILKQTLFYIVTLQYNNFIFLNFIFCSFNFKYHENNS